MAFLDFKGYISDRRMSFNSIFIPFLIASLLTLTAWYNYLLFHSLAESFASGVAIIMFVIAWHTYNFTRNHYLLFLGSGYFWIAVLDITHALTYKGMNIINSPFPDVSIQIWIASRYLQAATLLVFPFILRKKVNISGTFIITGLVAVTLLIVIFTGNFPTCFIEGEGLTPFKIYSEYIIISIFMLSIYFIHRAKIHLDKNIFSLLIVSIAITCASELAFTLYKDVYGISNIVGHTFKFFAFWFLYLAIIKTALTEPFKIMLHSSTTYDAIPEIIFMVDNKGIIRQVNDYTYKLLNLKPEDVIGQNCHNLFHDPAVETGQCLLCSYIKRNQKLPYYEFYHSSTGEWKSVSLTPVEHPYKGLIEVNIDITQRKSAEERLFEEKERAIVTLQSIGDGVITTDGSGIITNLNSVAEDLTGWTVKEAIGQKIETVFSIVSGISFEPIPNPIYLCLDEEKVQNLSENTSLIKKDGTFLSIDDSAAPIRDRDGRIIGSILVFHDVSVERELQTRLEYHAKHDNLTGLLNRFHFEGKIRELLLEVRSGSGEHSVLYIDLDQFKIVNDTCGHIAGDEVLRQLSFELKKHIRATDILARLGGDEFGLILHSCAIDDAVLTADKIRMAVKDFRFVWQDNIFEMGCSIGITTINSSSKGIESILSESDMACYAAKEAGRNKIHVYSTTDKEISTRKTEMQWVNRINLALKQKQFRIYKQKIIPLQGDDLRPHYEILLRLHEDNGEIRLPGSFIPAAERYDLMVAIDRWVVTEVIKNYDKFVVNGQIPVIAVNLSGFSLSNLPLLDFIHESISSNQLPPAAFCFEITETSAIANLQNAAHFIRTLKSIGCLFALDDFGSGVSSFSYLKNLDVDFVKIDGVFVKNIEVDDVSMAMVESINKISKVMGIRTIAEFVETEPVLEKLRAAGIDYAQGFFIGKPEPV